MIVSTMYKYWRRKRGGLFVFFPFLFFSFLLSCSTKDPSLDLTHRFQESGSIQFNLDSLTSIDATSVIPAFIDSILHLFISNELNNSIDVYSEKDGLLSRRFTFEREGPLGISQVRTCVIRSPDSIYVIGKFNILDAKMIDWEGTVTDERPIFYDWNKSKSTVVNHMGDILLFDNKLYLSIGPLFDLNNPDNFNKSISYEYLYDFKLGRLESLPVFVPLSYQGKPQNFYSIVPTRTIDSKGRFIYSWPNDKELNIISLQKTDTISSKFAHINSFGNTITLTKGKRNPKEMLVEALEHVLYTKILYDPYKNVIYRIASIPSGLYQQSDLDHWTAFGRNKVAIIALDEKFNIIAWEILGAELYNCFRAFVGEKGLYISRANIYRDDFDEDKLDYTVFDLVPN